MTRPMKQRRGGSEYSNLVDFAAVDFDDVIFRRRVDDLLDGYREHGLLASALQVNPVSGEPNQKSGAKALTPPLPPAGLSVFSGMKPPPPNCDCEP